MVGGGLRYYMGIDALSGSRHMPDAVYEPCDLSSVSHWFAPQFFSSLVHRRPPGIVVEYIEVYELVLLKIK